MSTTDNDPIREMAKRLPNRDPFAQKAAKDDDEPEGSPFAQGNVGSGQQAKSTDLNDVFRRALGGEVDEA